VRFVVEVFLHEGSLCNREKEREVNTVGLGFAFERRQKVERVGAQGRRSS
jgi:hypothetical protein